MRQLIPVLLATGLSGCAGFDEFMDHTFTNPGLNPNIPMTDSENVRLIRSLNPAIQPLEVELGNVWPKFDIRDPTLEFIANNPGREDARKFEPITISGGRPGLPAHRQTVPARGSFPPPGQTQPESLQIPSPLLLPSSTTANVLKLSGGITNIPNGLTVGSSSTNGYRTRTTPSSLGAIVAPNRNGTSTIINSNGSIQTVPTPR